MSNTRFTYLQKEGLEESPTPQGLSGISFQRDQLCCPGLVTLACFKHIGRHQRKRTPLDVLRMEAGDPSIAAQAYQQDAMAYGKAYRLATNHPRRRLLEEPYRN